MPRKFNSPADDEAETDTPYNRLLALQGEMNYNYETGNDISGNRVMTDEEYAQQMRRGRDQTPKQAVARTHRGSRDY